MRGRTTAGLSILAALALAVPGCTGDTSPQAAAASPTEIVLAANTRMTAAKSAKVHAEYTVNAPGQAAVTMTADGVLDAKARTADVTVTLPGLGKVALRIVDGAIYAKVPEAMASLSPKPWLKLDVAALGAAVGQFGSQNPADHLDMLAGMTDVTEVGSEKIDGVETTHYRGKVDVAKAIKAATNPAARKNLESAAKAMATATMPADVWIDKQGRLRKMTFTMTAKPAAGSGVKGNATMVGAATFSDFGTPVKVTAPPAADVADMKDLQGK
jgi:hypothetical protein